LKTGMRSTEFQFSADTSFFFLADSPGRRCTRPTLP